MEGPAGALALATLGVCWALSAPADEPNAEDARAVSRGAALFQRYCTLCHGANGTGHGRAARLHDPPPTDLTRSVFGDAYRELIIRGGGASVGRSSGMPPWKYELSDRQIRDLIAYLRTLQIAGS